MLAVSCDRHRRLTVSPVMIILRFSRGINRLLQTATIVNRTANAATWQRKN
jgi:hypothetical protein